MLSLTLTFDFSCQPASLANAHVHLYTNTRRHLFGAENAYQMCLYVAHSQSFQLEKHKY